MAFVKSVRNFKLYKTRNEQLVKGHKYSSEFLFPSETAINLPNSDRSGNTEIGRRCCGGGGSSSSRTSGS